MRQMEIEQYILRRKTSIERLNGRIKDFEVFDFNYIPSRPLMREEIKPMVDSFLRYDKTNIPNNLVIVGSKGTGKTLTIRYLKNYFEAKSGLKILYANCRQLNTSFKIIAGLLNIKPRGLCLNELYDRFRAAYPQKTIIILDEVDLISEKDRKKDILYFLSRADRSYMSVLLSNSPRFLTSMDAPTCSSLQPSIIHFKNYNAIEIAKILTERARAGLRHYNLKVISQIAALTTQFTNSDVRVAIKTLYYWATHTERSVKDNFHKAQKDVVVDIVNDLNEHNILILKAIAETKEKFVKAVYERYKYFSKAHGLDGFSYVYFYNTLSYLQSLGLILLFSTKINRVYTNTINLTFEPSIIESIYNIRFSSS